jgi:hypothetical protein
MPAETNGRKVLSAMPAASAALRASFQAHGSQDCRLGDVDQFGEEYTGGVVPDPRLAEGLLPSFGSKEVRSCRYSAARQGLVRRPLFRRPGLLLESTERRDDRAPYRRPRSHNRQGEPKPTQAQLTQAGAYSAVPSRFQIGPSSSLRRPVSIVANSGDVLHSTCRSPGNMWRLGCGDGEAGSKYFKAFGNLCGSTCVIIRTHQQRAAKCANFVDRVAARCEPRRSWAHRGWLVGCEINIGFDLRQLRLRPRRQSAARRRICGPHHGAQATKREAIAGSMRLPTLTGHRLVNSR